MKAMVLNRVTDLGSDSQPLQFMEIDKPQPAPDQLLIRVAVCGVCHTEMDEIEGLYAAFIFPMIPGHQVIGFVESKGAGVQDFSIGDRVGVAWIYSSCGTCRFCLKGEENLCEHFKATGRDVFGGYAEYMTVPAVTAFPVPAIFSDIQAAPLLCAGAIGYRSLRLTGIQNGQNLGLMGFGASAHLLLQMVRHHWPLANVFVWARSETERSFAHQLGASWAGDIHERAPVLLDAIIDSTPVWKPVVEAMKNLAPGGRLVINAIRKEDVDKNYFQNLDYAGHLWLEKEIKSVANVTRKDVSEFLNLAAAMQLNPEVKTYALQDANQALIEMKRGEIRGAKVLVI